MPGHVRNITLSDGSSTLELGLWNEMADMDYHTGDVVAVSECVPTPKMGPRRYGSTGLSSVYVSKFFIVDVFSD